MREFFKFFLACLLGSTVILSGCTRTPERDFNDQDLLIDVSVMPANWSLLDVYPMDNEEGEESGQKIVFYKTDTTYLVRAGQDVFRYSSRNRAAWHYQRLENIYFENSFYSTVLPMPEDFKFSSLIADQSRFGCTVSTFSPTPEFGKYSTICIYFAQYAEFLVFVTMKVRIDEQEMATMSDFYRLVEAVDQKMAENLEQTP